MVSEMATMRKGQKRQDRSKNAQPFCCGGCERDDNDETTREDRKDKTGKVVDVSEMTTTRRRDRPEKTRQFKACPPHDER